ncbi:glyoxalase [Diplodia corticola]|uniref:Glyoxalase n=1 Tax=Diplodia corticola TaxID=236234 RepID=A0A1J9RNL0_9PEZI|nr:glyoxalase [Diplodia corticola]OJD29516.1 glyoxalase [Diplodia corticola]
MASNGVSHDPNPLTAKPDDINLTLASQKTYNRVFNHVGVSVSDAEATVAWYTKVLGFKLLGTVCTITRAEHPEDAIFGIYPESLQEVKLAKMATGNGVGFEIFEFVNPKFQQAKEFEYNRGGFFHICVTDPDPDAVARTFIAEGGKQIGKTVDPSGNGDIKTLYLADPWGNVVEVVDVNFEYMGLKSALI